MRFVVVLGRFGGGVVGFRVLVEELQMLGVLVDELQMLEVLAEELQILEVGTETARARGRSYETSWICERGI